MSGVGSLKCYATAFARFSIYDDETDAIGDPRQQIGDCHVARPFRVIQASDLAKTDFS